MNKRIKIYFNFALLLVSLILGTKVIMNQIEITSSNKKVDKIFNEFNECKETTIFPPNASGDASYYVNACDTKYIVTFNNGNMIVKQHDFGMGRTMVLNRIIVEY
ncbi:hypothetical protein [Paenibacillus radicis (ex Gao et al. 2016)]|uniref:Uncharacterized protein n=1 Tax=Paenibacillus radicis (ex Gao et al. 2016) TaxID=1737354 RepID=A0A917LWL9_9BACL|nr:hypothetical protein [Paenibacillus radicis (ex Gao et al. 2016)]GGG60107.1 hypothetical protein GCM10010918_11650 [Paenibacillus radicis (ex Gao et al. 2016)]